MICDLAIWQAGSSRPYTSQANIYKHCMKNISFSLGRRGSLHVRYECLVYFHSFVVEFFCAKVMTVLY